MIIKRDWIAGEKSEFAQMIIVSQWLYIGESLFVLCNHICQDLLHTCGHLIHGRQPYRVQTANETDEISHNIQSHQWPCINLWELLLLMESEE